MKNSMKIKKFSVLLFLSLCVFSFFILYFFFPFLKTENTINDILIKNKGDFFSLISNDKTEMYYSDISNSFYDEYKFETDLNTIHSKNQIGYVLLNYIPKNLNFIESKITYFMDKDSSHNLLKIKSGRYNKGKYNIYKLNSNYENNIKKYNVLYNNENSYLSYSSFLLRGPLNIENNSLAFKKLKINSKYFDEIYLREENNIIDAYIVLPMENIFDFYEVDSSKIDSLKLSGKYEYKVMSLQTSNISREEFIKIIENIIYVSP